jgi:predicted O-linked N-acetylglucosamine transferase (SPINDLY family)
VITPDLHRCYSEKIVTLPHSYQPNDTQRSVADTPPDRKTAGLPDDAFVFCCFNSPFKITPATFDAWMRVLKAVPHGVLWLLQVNAQSAINLRREAAARGVDPARLVFAPEVKPPEHLARHRLADLFLDTLPYNAHTTASDALFMSLPVLTLSGRTFATRVAASLLLAVGLPELITKSFAEYEELAVRLAGEPGRLRDIRNRLGQARTTQPLFDTPRLARDIERALAEMHRRALGGAAPQGFAVVD